MSNDRRNKIIEIIVREDIDTQEELAKKLNEAGFNVTQATVSRDIKTLQLEKIPNSKGGSKYALPQNQLAYKEKFLRIFRDGYSNVLQAGNIVVIKTVSGMAMAVAAALDDLGIPEIVGSIAGDDTIMCATKSEEDAKTTIEKITNLLQNA